LVNTPCLLSRPSLTSFSDPNPGAPKLLNPDSLSFRPFLLQSFPLFSRPPPPFNLRQPRFTLSEYGSAFLADVHLFPPVSDHGVCPFPSAISCRLSGYTGEIAANPSENHWSRVGIFSTSPGSARNSYSFPSRMVSCCRCRYSQCQQAFVLFVMSSFPLRAVSGFALRRNSLDSQERPLPSPAGSFPRPGLLMSYDFSSFLVPTPKSFSPGLSYFFFQTPNGKKFL